MKRTTISLPEKLAGLLEHEARRKHVSVSALVRTLLEKALVTGPRTRKVPWAGLFDDPDMVSGDNVDEELERIWARDIESDR